MKSGMKDYPTSLGNPVDSTAARVISKGTSHEYDLSNYIGEIWETPPPTEPYNRTKNPNDAPSLVGQKHGRIEIIGYLGKTSNSSKWLARCDCGLYVTRSGNAWRKAKPHALTNDVCPRCARMQDRQRHYDRSKHFEMTGKWPHEK